MCLLVVLTRVVRSMPLVVAANRDEFLTRPAVAMTVLDPGEPPRGLRILGGRDELAGGTWLAINDAGVVAGLTNRPAVDGRDPAKRSRGELPIALARFPTAASAVADLATTVRPQDYNPAWMLVGDRAQLYFVDLTGVERVEIEELEPGIHVLENRGLHQPSPKAAHVRERVTSLIASLPGHEQLVDGLADILRDHHRPIVEEPADDDHDGDNGDDDGSTRRPETLAACVHSEANDYGTRSAAIITVADDIAGDVATRPDVRFADGPLCRAPLQDANTMWTS